MTSWARGRGLSEIMKLFNTYIKDNNERDMKLDHETDF